MFFVATQRREAMTEDERKKLSELKKKEARERYEKEEREAEEKYYGYLFWCSEGCGFVKRNHQCEQWTSLTYIPPRAAQEIRQSVLAELEREVEARIKDINKTLGAGDMETSIRRGGAEAELEWFSSLIRSKKGGA
jgi:hypothetical protein